MTRSRSTRTPRRLLFAVAAVLAAVAMPACQVEADEDPALGQLDVTWSLGPADCTEAGVDRIAIAIDGANVQQAPCADGSTVVENLEPGRRQLVLTGLDATGIERFAAEPVTVTVPEGDVARADGILLSALPAQVDITWYFTNGRLCSTNDVESIEVSIWRDGFLDGQAQASCDDGSATLTDLTSGTYLVELRALDGDDALVTTTESEVVLDKGDRMEVEVALEVSED